MANFSNYSRQALKAYVNNGAGHGQPRPEWFVLCTKSQPYQLAGYRSVRGPHFGTAPEPALKQVQSF